jgi:hypothetical protein
MQKSNLFILGSFLLALMATTPYASCTKKSIADQEAIEDQLKNLAPKDNSLFSHLRRKYYATKKNLETKVSVTQKGIASFVLGTVATFLASRDPKLSALVGMTTGSITYALSAYFSGYFSESPDLLDYRLTYEAYNETLSSIKDLLHQKNENDLTEYISFHHKTTEQWPLMQELQKCNNSHNSCVDLLKKLNNARSTSDDLRGKRKELKSLVENTMRDLVAFSTFIKKQDEFKRYEEIQNAAKKKNEHLQQRVHRFQNSPKKNVRAWPNHKRHSDDEAAADGDDSRTIPAFFFDA